MSPDVCVWGSRESSTKLLVAKNHCFRNILGLIIELRLTRAADEFLWRDISYSHENLNYVKPLLCESPEIPKMSLAGDRNQLADDNRLCAFCNKLILLGPVDGWVIEQGQFT